MRNNCPAAGYQEYENRNKPPQWNIIKSEPLKKLNFKMIFFFLRVCRS